jgi:hypothetical protein
LVHFPENLLTLTREANHFVQFLGRSINE